MTDDAALDLMTTTIESGGVVHAFGTGHSEAFAMEIAGRAGGFIPTNKIALRDLVLRGSLGVDQLGGRHAAGADGIDHRHGVEVAEGVVSERVDVPHVPRASGRQA